MTFGDAIFEPFNAAAGSVTASLANLFQGRQNFTWIRGKHSIRAGAEFRANRDTILFRTPLRTELTRLAAALRTRPSRFDRSAVRTRSESEKPLPDSFSAFLSGSAFSYTVAVAPPDFPQGDQIGVAAVSRYNVNFLPSGHVEAIEIVWQSTMDCATSCTGQLPSGPTAPRVWHSFPDQTGPHKTI